MIKYLNGIKETVDFDPEAMLMLYDNTDYEEYPIHWHSPIEIIMPLEGNYSLECDDVFYNLREEDILIISPGTLHHIYAHHGRRIIFQIDCPKLLSLGELESSLSLMPAATLITPEDYPQIHSKCTRLLLEIVDEYFGKASLRGASIVQKFLELIILVRRYGELNDNRFANIRPGKQQEYSEKFFSICEYINQHCTEDLSLDEIASMAGFSKYHFSRLFKEFAGVSFYKYLNARRIAYAEKLLLDPRMNVSEIAARSGFNSISAFMRMFKLIRNCTPTQFRKLNDQIIN